MRDRLLDQVFHNEGRKLEVAIEYETSSKRIVISDNSIGMDQGTLDRAMEVGRPPPNPTGRSRYGMGLKTAACWLGDFWTVTTTRLGSPVQLKITVDVDVVAGGMAKLPLEVTKVDPATHYTVVEISRLNRTFRGRTLGKIKDYLASMYRVDLREGRLDLKWRGQSLGWQDAAKQFLKAKGGGLHKRDVTFAIGPKKVSGWVGVLARGSRSQAGFSILHSGRVIRGWPESWRPEEVFGQVEGSNDLVNQRLVGEFNLDAFEVTHTKDDILWSEDNEEAVEKAIRSKIEDLISVASTTRTQTKKGPSRVSIRGVWGTLQADLNKARAAESGDFEQVATLRAGRGAKIAERYSQTKADVTGDVLGQHVHAYLSDEEGPEAIYAAIPLKDADKLVVVANLRHPFLTEVTSTEALTVYLRMLLIELIALSAEPRTGSLTDSLIVRERLMRAMCSDATEGD